MEPTKKGYRFTTDIPPLHRVRMVQIFLSTSQVANILQKSPSWPRKNTHLFITKRVGRNIKYELSTVLEYYFIEHLNKQ